MLPSDDVFCFESPAIGNTVKCQVYIEAYIDLLFYSTVQEDRTRVVKQTLPSPLISYADLHDKNPVT